MPISKASSNAVAAAAKGDLVVGSATNDSGVLAVGSANQVLTVDSSTATGLKWAAATAAGSNFTLLNSGGTALTGAATITVSGISGADKIMILIQNASTASASPAINVRFNTDSTGKYGFSMASNTIADPVATSNFSTDAQLTATEFRLGQYGNSNLKELSGYLFAQGCNSSGLKIVNFTGSGNVGDATPNGRQNIGGGFYSGTSTISSISVVSGSGNFDAGTVYVYTSA